MSLNPTLQSQVINYLKIVIPPRQSLADILISELGVSKSTAYKKIKGQVGISMDELEILGNKYNIPISTFLGRTSDNIFSLDALELSPRHPIEYLQRIAIHFKSYLKYDDIEFIYISNMIPIFHLLQFPALITLKLYIWDITNWKTEHSDDRSFSIRAYADRLKDFEVARKQILDCYLKIKGIEIWNIRFLDILVEQFKYVLINRMLTDEAEIKIIIDQLKQLYHYLEQVANEGLKYEVSAGKVSFKNDIAIYNNQVIESTNLIFGQSPQFSSVYSTLDTPNYMNCLSPEVANLVKRWLDQVIIHSFKISREGKSERLRFFRELKSRLDFSFSEIDKILLST